ncbi:hypothetical protein CYMTET_26694 [Cymbomonas tetramitiformis]|uniref:Pseudouridine synthase RsuA/RluA-like domain-containing protein n=1 Tax=Cymbomonas tetramitiformis TaxID=36881 RepID=A0AAE0FSS5_9CHLO|nr:hypothetical protein CYMTET_26694 [Cymbomonas tetramitiformis]|eukprot:gene3186-4031_t
MATAFAAGMLIRRRSRRPQAGILPVEPQEGTPCPSGAGKDNQRVLEKSDIAVMVKGPPRYLVVNGLRYVEPYLHTFHLSVAAKHVGASSTLGELLPSLIHEGEDGAKGSPRYWASEVDAGRLHVAQASARGEDLAAAPRDAALRALQAIAVPGTSVRVTRHVHENVISAKVPAVLYEDAVFFVVDKPGGLPCHAGVGPGLEGENNGVALLRRLLRCPASTCPVNRLDKPVSGVWILAKTGKLAGRARAALAQPGSQKTYLARVDGEFRHLDELLVEQPLCRDSLPPASIARVISTGKASTTRFKRLGYDPKSNTSLLRCRLQHGRFHQIRAHLKWLGHPVANDALYGGSHRGQGGGTPIYADDNAGSLKELSQCTFLPWCDRCHWTASLLRDPNLDSWDLQPPAGEAIWLHAAKYELQAFGRHHVFQSGVPPWVLAFVQHMSPEEQKRFEEDFGS